MFSLEALFLGKSFLIFSYSSVINSFGIYFLVIQRGFIPSMQIAKLDAASLNTYLFTSSSSTDEVNSRTLPESPIG
jgi:hypothetical protein